MKKALGYTLGVIVGILIVALLLVCVVCLTGLFSAIIAGAVYLVFMLIANMFGLTLFPFWYVWVAIFIAMIVAMIFDNKKVE